ncbi:MAG: dienelactone hydrolase family protein [Gemmatimonadaceae bacterium]
MLVPVALLVGACSVQRVAPQQAAATPATSAVTPARSAIVAEHADHDMDQGASVVSPVASVQQGQGAGVAAGAADVAERLARSTRHAEWAMVPTAPGASDSIAAWVVFPERRDNAPVVVVIHEIFGLSSWVRGVADQLAADGFIAIAPDLLSIERGGATTDSMAFADARAMIGRVTPDKMNAMVAAVAQYGMALPAAAKSYGVVGYCWGGSASFNHAVFGAPGLRAAVVYYGSSPTAEEIAKVRIPVLGLYGENDQRVNATIARADSTMRATGVTFVQKVYAGAGHGFLRAQDQPANADASRQAWPETVAWFRRHLH